MASIMKAQKAAPWSWHHCLKKQHSHNGYLCLGYFITYVNILCLLTLFVISTKELVLSYCFDLGERKRTTLWGVFSVCFTTSKGRN